MSRTLFMRSTSYIIDCRTNRMTVDAKHECYLSLGSNLGDRLSHLRTGIRILRSGGMMVESISTLYETEPIDMVCADHFFNLALKVKTSLSPEEMLGLCLAVEQELGRSRKSKSDPRVFDADILLYDDLIIKSERLTIPHPRMHARRFVLVPLAEIAPDLLHPVFKKSVTELLDECADDSKVVKCALTFTL